MNLLITLNSNIVIRNFIHTGVLERLSSRYGYKITVLTSTFPSLQVPSGVNSIYVHQNYSLIFRFFIALNWFFHRLLRSRYQQINDNNSYRLFFKSPFNNHWKHILLFFASYPFPRSKRIYRLISLFEKLSRFHNAVYEKEISSLRPQVVIVTMPNSRSDYPVLCAATALNLRKILAIKSWDNVTTKGYLPVEGDAYCVWNEFMRWSLLSTWPTKSRCSVYVSGAPQLEYYVKYARRITRSSLLKMIFQESVDRYVVYATSPDTITKSDPEIIERLLEFLRPLGVGLVVKVHQLDNISRYDSFTDRAAVLYNLYRFNGTVCDGAGMYCDDHGDSLLAANILDSNFNILHHADVVICTYSTIVFDAAACGTLTININFDYPRRLRYYNSVERLSELEHFRSLKECRDYIPAHSFDDLTAHLLSITKHASKPQTTFDANGYDYTLSFEDVLRRAIDNQNSSPIGVCSFDDCNA